MKKRIWELDFLRGFAIIMMVFDHLMYDFKSMDSYFYNFASVNNSVFEWLNKVAKLYWVSDLRFAGHFFFISVFLLVSGISFTFSRNNLWRGTKFLIVAILISIVTWIGESTTGIDMFIIFGIIHMFAVCTLLTYLFRKIWNNDMFILIVGLAILALGIYNKFWTVYFTNTLSWSNLPKILYGTLGYGADYFGIVPYLGIIMIGTVIGNTYYKNRVSLIPNKKITDKNIVIFAGRKSLIIFVTHQLVLFGLLYIVGLIFGYRM